MSQSGEKAIDAREPDASPSEGEAKESVRLLIVEDHYITRVGLRLALSRYSEFQVVAECASGDEALKLVSQVSPDLVLMDIGLPGISGIEAAALIKNDFPNVKIVMLTSHETDADVAAALAAKCDGYCLKEAQGDSLADAINAVMRGSIWLDPGIARRVVKVFVDSKEGAAKPTENLLSAREMQVLALVVEGLSNQAIGEKLCISAETVKTHMRRLMEKLSVSDRTQAAVVALRKGLL